MTRQISVAVVGIGNCAGSLIEGLNYYRNNSTNEGLLFPILGGYGISDINIVCGFDIADGKVNRPLSAAIYCTPNNFFRLSDVSVQEEGLVYRGPTLDGNPDHLKKFVVESHEAPVDVVDKLKHHKVDVLVNLLPTGSDEATRFYAESALQAGCAFINCIPTEYAQIPANIARFEEKKLPLIGDDIKSQVGSTIIHRSILDMLLSRGAKISKSSQLNMGGNTDFANFVYRAHTKLISKYKSLSLFIDEDTPNHIGHHYDPTKGPFKKTLFDIEALVFGGSKVKISIQLESDDKPNSAGSIIDLVRISQCEKEKGNGGCVYEACAYYTKSAPKPLKDKEALELVRRMWASNERVC
jgi:myo-inositol-1-phosphate synthase